MRVGVLGAGGPVAPAVVRELGESVDVVAMHCLDADGERATVIAQTHGAGKASAAAVEPGDGRALTAALEECDLVIDAADDPGAVEAALAAGCHYVAVAAGPDDARSAQVGVRGTRDREALVASVNAGSDPDVAGAVAAAAVRLIARGRVGDPLRPDDFLSELSERGCRFDITTHPTPDERGST